MNDFSSEKYAKHFVDCINYASSLKRSPATIRRYERLES